MVWGAAYLPAAALAASTLVPLILGAAEIASRQNVKARYRGPPAGALRASKRGRSKSKSPPKYVETFGGEYYQRAKKGGYARIPVAKPVYGPKNKSWSI